MALLESEGKPGRRVKGKPGSLAVESRQLCSLPERETGEPG